MHPQITCRRRGKVTLAAFVWLLSNVCFKMVPQGACIRGCKVTLVAFVWLVSSVRFQMCPQNGCIKVTLAAFVLLFSTVYFQMLPKIFCLRRGIVTLVTLHYNFIIIYKSRSHPTIYVVYIMLYLSRGKWNFVLFSQLQLHQSTNLGVIRRYM